MSAPVLLKGHDKDLGGGFMVRRLLPSAQKQGIGPFLFFDHFGPVTIHPEDNHDVRPHPHIGLSTVSYLFEGAIMHRDSLGSEQVIEPGAINWMTAGRGIVHSERGPAELRKGSYVNHGIQLWAALPVAAEEVEPEFIHTPAAAIPELAAGDAEVRVLVGSAFGATSPVKVYSETLYLDVKLPPGGVFELPALAPELGLYSVDQAIEVDGAPVEAHRMALLAPGQATRIVAPQGARLMLLGGEPIDGHRLMWWNFVSSRRERILEAAQAWQDQTMGQVPGESELIPLPEKRLA